MKGMVMLQGVFVITIWITSNITHFLFCKIIDNNTNVLNYYYKNTMKTYLILPVYVAGFESGITLKGKT